MGKNPRSSNDGTLEKGFLLISFSALSHQTMQFFPRYFSYFFLMSRTNSNNFVPATSKEEMTRSFFSLYTSSKLYLRPCAQLIIQYFLSWVEEGIVL